MRPNYTLTEHLYSDDSFGNVEVLKEALYEVRSYSGVLCCIDLVTITEALNRIVRGRTFEVLTERMSFINYSNPIRAKLI